jgi:flagellar hook assembly protein FlgD
LPVNGKVSLKIFNVLGQEVRTLVNDYETAGYKQVRWDGKNNSGKAVASGIYFYRIEVGKFIQSRKMLMLK